MGRLGLALSGGGFRATLYHLGVVRYLRDAGLLQSVTHITSVSGGSILAAHLGLNWDRYCGEPEEFEAAAKEILDFVHLDVRNRIIRRYFFTGVGNTMLRMFRRRSWRRLTRTGLLKQFYERKLYGEAALCELPNSPELHILSTNLSGGGLTSFSRDGVYIEERSADGVQLTSQDVGLTTVSQAVAASSAFPGFFPPLEFTADDIGCSEGEFPTQYFTDGGVYDNLGIRMFEHLEQRRQSLHVADFFNVRQAMKAWNNAIGGQDRTPLNRLVEINNAVSPVWSAKPAQQSEHAESPEQFCQQLQRLMTSTDLKDDHVLADLLPGNGNGNGNGSHGHLAQHSERERWRRNRQLLNRAFQQVTGEQCLNKADGRFSTVIASDAGKKFSVSRPDQMNGFIRTAMRSSDILMDRVWQLEKERCANAEGFVFAPITKTVSLADDPTALHPEIQRQVTDVRTDLDRFRRHEIVALIRHGYSVAKSTCAHLAHHDPEATDCQPWTPYAIDSAKVSTARRNSTATEAKPSEDASVEELSSSSVTRRSVRDARRLQPSRRRRFLPLFFAPSDWVSYLYLPLLVVLLVVLPMVGFRFYRSASINAMLKGAMAELRVDYGKMLDLLEYGPEERWTGMPYTDVDKPTPLFGQQGLDIITDTRITDFRNWFALSNEADAVHRWVYSYRHVLVRKTEQTSGETALQLPPLWDFPELTIRCENEQLKPVLQRFKRADVQGKETYGWEIKLDFEGVPIGSTVDVVVEAIIPPQQELAKQRSFDWTRFQVDAKPEVITAWVLFPADKRSKNMNLVSYQAEDPNTVELVVPTHQAIVQGGEIVNWSVVHPRPDCVYSCRWD